MPRAAAAAALLLAGLTAAAAAGGGGGAGPPADGLRWGEADFAFGLRTQHWSVARRYRKVLPQWWRKGLQGTLWIGDPGRTDLPNFGACKALSLAAGLCCTHFATSMWVNLRQCIGGWVAMTRQQVGAVLHSSRTAVPGRVVLVVV